MRELSPDEEETLTVGQVASLVGVSVRTLHHWDQIGLVRPSGRSWAGYRLYTGQDVARMHRVLVYRETGMPLAQVARVLGDPDTDAFAHLARQRELLTERICHLTRMLRALDTMMEKDTMGDKMSAQQRAKIMGDQWDPAWEAEAEQRWGGTQDWKVWAGRQAGLTPQQVQADKARLEQVEEALARAKREGVRPGSERANQLAQEHRESLTWFEVTLPKQVVLARGYVDDPRFTAHYDSREPGLAAWLKEVIDANAAAHGLDPATATWE